MQPHILSRRRNSVILERESVWLTQGDHRRRAGFKDVTADTYDVLADEIFDAITVEVVIQTGFTIVKAIAAREGGEHLKVNRFLFGVS